MTDQFDRAQEIEQMQRDAALSALEDIRAPRQTLEQCEDCGDDIPEARRRAAPGCSRCIDCQQLHERRHRR